MSETVKVFDGYGMVEAKPAKDGHVLVLGSSYYKVPEGAYTWEIGHGTTGWWPAMPDRPMNDTLYSVPADSAMLAEDWETMKEAVRYP